MKGMVSKLFSKMRSLFLVRNEIKIMVDERELKPSDVKFKEYNHERINKKWK